MKQASFLWVWAIILLLPGSTGKVFAQDADIARAQRIYEWFAAGQGDSIHAALNKDLQQQLAPALFNDSFSQMERMFGKAESQGEWKADAVQGVTVYYSDVKFERYMLRFLLSFDADGTLNTIRMMPAPAVSTPQPVVYDKTRMDERELTVGADGYKLPATLTLPRQTAGASRHQFPCVVLVHGSGSHDRDETIGPNKPFRDFAWGLAERGIAVLRYDKRTKVYGRQSVPAGRELDFDTEAVDDAVAIVEQVKAMPEIAPDSIYVLGHSLGGTLAPRIAGGSDSLAGIIVFAGLARPFEDAILEQSQYICSLTASSDDVKAQFAELERQVANVKKLGTASFDDKIPLPLGQPRSYWLFANAYKPVEVAAGLKLPILVLQGERDYQVTMEDFCLWRAGLLRCKNAFFKSYPKLNHLFQEGSGKSTPFEYNQASSVPAYVIDDIASFVRGKRERF